ncbi:MAG: type II toxin-antitoxin system Phd/YefM family antitoxin [Candidatus Binataceae bacterium]
MVKPKIVNVHEAKTNFSKLLRRVRGGEEIIIAYAGRPVARMAPLATQRPDRKPGSAKGLIRIADDFDAPLPQKLQRAFQQ